jgi:hypothetical protein
MQIVNRDLQIASLQAAMETKPENFKRWLIKIEDPI